MFIYTLFFIPVILAVFALRTTRYPYKAGVTLSCVALVFLAFFIQDTSNRASLLLVIALLFSVAGDYFLSHKGEKGDEKPLWYLYGIGLFFLAHFFYFTYISRFSVFRPLFFFIVILPFLFYYVFRLQSHLPDLAMSVAIFFYLVISCCSLALVMGYQGEAWQRICLIGGISLIVFSDLCIGESDFMGWVFPKKLILPTYYTAHILLTLGQYGFIVN
jgi:uncharacterized membrane protein YhhN